jgi:hypothetical protein
LGGIYQCDGWIANAQAMARSAGNQNSAGILGGWPVAAFLREEIGLGGLSCGARLYARVARSSDFSLLSDSVDQAM